LGLAIFQSMGIALALEGSAGLVIDPGMGFRLTAVVSFAKHHALDARAGNHDPDGLH